MYCAADHSAAQCAGPCAGRWPSSPATARTLAVERRGLAGHSVAGHGRYHLELGPAGARLTLGTALAGVGVALRHQPVVHLLAQVLHGLIEAGVAQLRTDLVY